MKGRDNWTSRVLIKYDVFLQPESCFPAPQCKDAYSPCAASLLEPRIVLCHRVSKPKYLMTLPSKVCIFGDSQDLSPTTNFSFISPMLTWYRMVGSGEAEALYPHCSRFEQISVLNSLNQNHYPPSPETH